MNRFCHASSNFTCQYKTKKIWLNSICCKIFIYVHKNLFVPQTSDLLQKSTLIFLYKFHRKHSLLKLIIKELSPKINVKNIKNRVYLSCTDDWNMLILSVHLSVHKIKEQVVLLGPLQTQHKFRNTSFTSLPGNCQMKHCYVSCTDY